MNPQICTTRMTETVPNGASWYLLSLCHKYACGTIGNHAVPSGTWLAGGERAGYAYEQRRRPKESECDRSHGLSFGRRAIQSF
jgi:hypothetical protein